MRQGIDSSVPGPKHPVWIQLLPAGPRAVGVDLRLRAFHDAPALGPAAALEPGFESTSSLLKLVPELSSSEHQVLLESLILAQDERWRRA